MPIINVCQTFFLFFYNKMIKVFPNSIIAGSKGCKEKEFFVAEEAKKEDVKIDLI